MRKIKYIIPVIVSLLILSSCEDFLEETPKDQFSSNEFFKNATQAYNAVNILYHNGVAEQYNTGVYGGSGAMLYGTYMSGFFDNDYKGQEIYIKHCLDLAISEANFSGQSAGIWSGAYTAISRANWAILNIPEMDTPELSDGEKNQLTAEAKFFRAFNYYWLVRIFGEVPIITDVYESTENLYVAKSPISEVYNLIVEDLTWALDNGGLTNTPMPDNDFRISKGTVAAVLAEVYLTMSGYPLQSNHYADAASAAKQVISSGKYGLIENGATESESAYNTIRTSDDEEEYIYVIEYHADLYSAGWRPTLCYPNSLAGIGVFQYAITNNAYRPVDEYLNIYDPVNDLRRQEKQYFHSSLTYTNGDGEEETVNFETAPYLWHDDNALFVSGKSGKDLMAYGYADVLLIAAEAIARSEGVTAEAVGYLADVRARAYWQTDRSEIESALSGLSVDEFVEEVWTERFRELPFQTKVWFDMQRTRKYPETSDATPGVVTYADLIGHTNVWGNTFDEHHLLFPISETSLQRNPELTQNDGY